MPTAVVQIAAVQDVGRAFNPQGVYGQLEGGTAQSFAARRRFDEGARDVRPVD